MNRDFDQLIEIMKSNLSPNAPFLDSLTMAMRAVLSFFGDHFSILLATAHFRVADKCNSEKNNDYHEKLFIQYKKKFSHVIDIFIDNLRGAKKKGEIHCELDERAITGYIISILRGVLTDWRMQGRKGDADKEIGNIITFIGKGLDLQPAHA